MITYPNLLRYALVIYTLLSIAGSPLSLMRLLGVYDFSVVVRIILPLLMVPALLAVWHKFKSRIKIDRISYLLLFLTLFGFCIGIIRHNNAYYLIADTASVFIIFCVYTACIQTNVIASSLEKNINILAHIALISEGATIIIGYVLKIFLGADFYMSLANLMIVLPYSWYIASGKYRLAAACFLFVLLGGKIGSMLAVIMISLLHVLLIKRKGVMNVLIYGLIAIAGLNFGLFAIKNLEFDANNPATQVLYKLQSYNPYRMTDQGLISSPTQNTATVDVDEGTAVEDYGGGRAAEIIYALIKFNRLSFYPYLTGGGAGFTYDMYYMGEFRPNMHNTHFSPVSLVIRYGIPLTLLFYAFILISFSRIYRQLIYPQHNDKIIRTMYYYCTGAFVFSFTAFNIFAAALFWFFLGYLLSLPKIKKQFHIEITHPVSENRI